jgi:MtN3 and saliva related transmembrane protein
VSQCVGPYVGPDVACVGPDFSPALRRTLTFAVLLPSALALAGCTSIGIHDTQSLLLPKFHRSEVVGFIAGFGTTFAAIPDLMKMIKRRSSQGINPTMATIMAVFQVAWIYYGLLIASRPVIIWNIVGVLTNSLTVWAYRSFASHEREEAGRR